MPRWSPARAALVVVPAVVLSGLSLPVLGGGDNQAPDITRAPVDASVQNIALEGIDESVLEASAVAMASWDSLMHDDDVAPLGLAPLSDGPTVAFASDAHDHAEGAPTHDDHTQDDHANDDQDANPVELEPAVAMRAMKTDDFGLVGLASDEPWDPNTRVLVRVREEAGWTAWQPLVISEHGPDPGSWEAEVSRYGTEPLLTAQADGVEIRIDTPGGEAPANATVTLVDSPVVSDDARLPEPRSASLPLSTVAAGTASAPKPAIISRAEWGADETQRRGSARYSPTIKAAFVHHTTSTTNYTPEQAAAQVRNLYSWYVKGLKYTDMAYNFIVDRYGRLYEGRAGGMEMPVVGGHTAGFNEETFAVSALGNFQKDNIPPEQMAAMVDSISSLIAWKLAMHHRDPNGTIALTSNSSAGTSKYKPGQVANALVVGGHGDIGSTACPGKFLEQQLPAIRAAAGAKLGVTMVNPAASDTAWGASDPMKVSTWSNAPLAWNISISNRCNQVVRTLSGQMGEAGPLSVEWDKRDSSGNPVPPGTYIMTMTGNGNGEDIYPWVGTGRVLATAESPPDPCGAPESFSLTGAGYGHGVGMSQYGALAMAKAGYDAASIVTFYYQGTQVTPVQDDMDIKVNVEYRKAQIKARAEPLDASGGQIEVSVGGAVAVGNQGDEFTFTNEGGNVRVTKSTGGAVSDVGIGPSAIIKWAGTRDQGQAVGGPTVLNLINGGMNFGSPGHRYRYGTIEILPSGGQLNGVNSVRLRDEYLYGIAEVSSSWPDAAMQAQALAARTYAIAKMNAGLRGACNCHVDDGNGPYTDQTFAGYAKESGAKGERWVAAVNATHASPNTGNAIVFNGQPITAFYSSSNGGGTQASRDAWGGDLPYSQAVADPWSLTEDNPNRSWTVNVSQADMAKAFGVGEVRKVEVSERHASGAVKTMLATLADGSQVSRTGGEMRNALGLKSSYITAVDGSGGAAVTPPAASPGEPQEPEQPQYETQVKLLTEPALERKALTGYELKARILPKKKGVLVWRQELRNGEWVTVQKARTNAKGLVSFRTAKAWPPGVTTENRLVVVRKKQTIGLSESINVAVVPSVKPRTVSLVSPAQVSVPAGSSFVIKARVRPAKAGLQVWRQALVNGEWVTVQKARTKAKGKVTFRVKKATPAGATYTYRLIVVDKKQAAGGSPDITVTVQ